MVRPTVPAWASMSRAKNEIGRFWSEMNLNVDRLLDRCFTVLMALVFGVMILLIFNTLWLR
jgi:hypothetical protein